MDIRFSLLFSSLFFVIAFTQRFPIVTNLFPTFVLRRVIVLFIL